MAAPIHIRPLAAADLPFADSLRAAAGWNQTLADWRRFVGLNPGGCFLAEWDGEPAGTVTTTLYGLDLAWIGMALVHPERRGRGIGRRLLEKALEHLLGLGVRCVKLDATPAGRELYAKLGFREEWTLRRWRREGARPAPMTRQEGIAPWDADRMREIDEMDRAAFGLSRHSLLSALARESRAAYVAENEPGRVGGHGMLREGSLAFYLGPAVAVNSGTASRLVAALLAHAWERDVLWDIPDPNADAIALAERLGFAAQRQLTRMFLGPNPTPGDPTRQFAIAGPEIG